MATASFWFFYQTTQTEEWKETEEQKRPKQQTDAGTGCADALGMKISFGEATVEVNPQSCCSAAATVAL